jgi:serine protease AprX
MRKSALLTLFLIILFVLSSFSGSTVSSSVDESRSGIGNGPLDESRWADWIWDRDHNSIDDRLDEKIESDPTLRTGIFIDYAYPPTHKDTARLSVFDLEIRYVYTIIDTICARNVLVKDIEGISKLPGVVMVEYEEEITGYLDVGSPTVKARQSVEYSPNTVWDLGFLGTDVSVAILDSGVDDGPSPAPPPYHMSLDDLDDDITTIDDPKFIAGADVTKAIYVNDGSYNPDDGALGHGTHCAGVAVGTGGSSEFMGVAPQARLVDIKVMENYGSGVMGEVVRGIDWAVEHSEEFNLRILSMSIGANYNSDGNDAASQAVNNAADAGVISVVAAGNGGNNIIGPPASADRAIVVGALNDHNTIDRSDDNVWQSSNVGPRIDDGDSDPMDEMKPDVLAPGVNIMSAKSDTTGTNIQFSGTSMACPHVAGVVALMLEANPDLTPDEVKEILHATAEMPEDIEPSTPDDDVYNYAYGWGFVDAYKAVRMAQEDDITPPIISNVEVVDVGFSTATISWTTNKPSNSIIQYGETTALGLQIEDLDNYELDHSMTLYDLSSDTDYYYNIQAYDDNGFGPGESGILGPFHTDDQADTTPPKFLEGPYLLGAPDDTTATIYWRTDEVCDSEVEYGLDTSYGNLKTDLDDEFEHTIILTSLTPSTEYFYKVHSTDPSGNKESSLGFSFITASEPDTEPPEVTKGPDAGDITHESARITWETLHEASTTTVRWGKTISYEEGPFEDEAPLVDHSVKLNDLDPQTKYYYQIESADEVGNTVTIGDSSHFFTTLEVPDETKPEITGIAVTILTDESASIEWMTDEPGTSWVDYGEGNPGTEPSVGDNDYKIEHNISLEGLKPSTKYFYQVRSADQNGNERVSEKDFFVTLAKMDKEAPSILTGPSVWAIGESTATIVWTTDEDSDSTIHYGTTTDYGSSKNDPALTTNHQVILTDLTPETTYHFKVASSDKTGNSMESSDSTFETLDVSSPLEIQFLNLNSGDTLSGVVSIKGTVTGGIGNIKSVRYRIDDEEWRSTSSTSSFTILLDTSKYSEGEHTLTVEANVGEMTMQEDISFVIEHKEDDPSDSMLWVLFVLLAVVIIIVVVLIATRSISRGKPYPQSTANYGDYGDGSDVSSMGYMEQETIGLGFIPDDEPEPSFYQDEEVSFTPDGFEQEPELSFMPDSEEVHFNIPDEVGFDTSDEVLFNIPDEVGFDTSDEVQFDLSEGTELGPMALENIRCPKCHGSFDADLSSPVHCPHCGFSSSVKH